MLIRELMSHNVASCPPEASLEEVAHAMEDRDCGSIPIVEQGSRRLLGIITDRDIAIRAVAHGLNPRYTQAKDCMSDQLLTIREDQDLADALQLMESEHIRRIPVVDSNGQLCGMLAQADIAIQADESQSAELLRDISQAQPDDTWERRANEPRQIH